MLPRPRSVFRDEVALTGSESCGIDSTVVIERNGILCNCSSSATSTGFELNEVDLLGAVFHFCAAHGGNVEI